jgi:hypothetical protein
MKTYEFSENNSGGSWWLDRKKYDALLAAGWRYEVSDYDKEHGYDTKGWSTDDPVPYGWRHGLKGEFESIRAAVESFERATGEDFFALGCTCCGPPFSISGPGMDEYLSGSSVDYEPRRPW